MTKIDRSVPVGQQTWRQELVLVSSMPTRFVGILSPEEAERAADGKPFVLSNALTYVANYGLQPLPNGNHGLIVRPHELLPFDLITHLTMFTVNRWEHLIRIADQHEDFSNWMYERYMNYFDPPRLVGADKITLSG